MSTLGSFPSRRRDRQLQLCVVWPWAHREEHAISFTQTCAQPTCITGAQDHTRAEHNEIDGIEECRDDGSSLFRWRCRDDGKSFYGYAVVSRRSEAQRGSTNDNCPGTLGHSVGQGCVEEPAVADLGNCASPDPPEREERGQVGSDRQQAFDAAHPAPGATDHCLKFGQGWSR